jgi:RNA recognition motif-containing protein
MSSKLFVGNLSFNSTEDSLREAFSEFGAVNEVAIMTDRDTGRSRGFGFITMNSAQEAEAAISGMSGRSVDGRDLTVNIAKPREERSGGGGGGGYRGGGGGGGGRNRY